MSDRSFLDTNVLLYAYDRDAGDKHNVASDLVREIWQAGTGALSTQVLQEFYVNVTAKITPPLSPSQARAIVSRYFVWHVEPSVPQSVRPRFRDPGAQPPLVFGCSDCRGRVASRRGGSLYRGLEPRPDVRGCQGRQSVPDSPLDGLTEEP